MKNFIEIAEKHYSIISQKFNLTNEQISESIKLFVSNVGRPKDIRPALKEITKLEDNHEWIQFLFFLIYLDREKLENYAT